MGCSKSSSKGKFIAQQSYLKKQEISQINNLTLHLQQLEKEKPKNKTNKQKKKNKEMTGA